MERLLADSRHPAVARFDHRRAPVSPRRSPTGAARHRPPSAPLRSRSRRSWPGFVRRSEQERFRLQPEVRFDEPFESSSATRSTSDRKSGESSQKKGCTRASRRRLPVPRMRVSEIAGNPCPVLATIGKTGTPNRVESFAGIDLMPVLDRDVDHVERDQGRVTQLDAPVSRNKDCAPDSMRPPRRPPGSRGGSSGTRCNRTSREICSSSDCGLRL